MHQPSFQLSSARWLAAGPDVAPSTAASLDLAWVRLMRAGQPAFDALDPSDLVIMSRAALDLVSSAGDGIVALVRGCVETRIGGIVLVDPSRLDDCFVALDYFEKIELPYVVAVNQFSGRSQMTLEEVREAVNVDPDVPVVSIDARGPFRLWLMSTTPRGVPSVAVLRP